MCSMCSGGKKVDDSNEKRMSREEAEEFRNKKGAFAPFHYRYIRY